MSNKSEAIQTGRSLLVAMLVVAMVGSFIWFLVGDRGQGSQQAETAGERRADNGARAPIASMNHKALRAWQLAHGLDQAQINDILPDANGTGVWLATDRGLAHVDATGHASMQPHFTSPQERVRDLVRTQDGIAMTLLWPSASGSGNRGATVVYDPLAQTYRQIGPYLRVLVGHGNDLYGVAARRLVRLGLSGTARITGTVKPVVDVCRVVQVISADSALWLAHQGRFRRGPAPSDDDPCGVVRLRPAADVRAWNADNGLVSGHARAIVADHKAVYVAYGIKADGLSVFDLASRQWQHMNGTAAAPLRAHVLGLSPTTIWLGSPDVKQPLQWVNRATGEMATMAGVPDKHVVAAMATTDSGAWVALTQKEDNGNGYTLSTWLARVQDPLRAN